MMQQSLQELFQSWFHRLRMICGSREDFKP